MALSADTLAAAAAALGIVLASCRMAAGAELPEGPNRDLVYATCQTCHGLENLTESAGIDRDQWSAVLDSMAQYGLQITAAERAKILAYLATYLGPHPPPPAPAKTSAPAAAPADAAALFGATCATCHQDDGSGVAGYFPPLAGNHDLFLDRLFPVTVVLNGIAGKITVSGSSFDSQMPALANLSDTEIAALVNYVRGAWGNGAIRPQDMPPVDAKTVAQARKKPMSPVAVAAYRRGLEKTNRPGE